ncbi:hypothetical protein BDV96DRAFT_642116 [Lophiotrema nucula]|uniref:Uncharacterized protein n=1 Tax=Lophiotrema nucula TaxID=690887 RepID=A0A6A5ZMQ9_9PLEO|nr:hypothetical protein BDV96DRAFT_642116 [Lophiotrema nucula]
MSIVTEDTTRQFMPNTTVTRADTTTTGSRIRKKRSPEDYARAISAHASLGKETSLFPGSNYRHLVQYLTGSLSLKQPIQRTDADGRTFHGVIVHDLALRMEDGSGYTEYDGCTDTEQLAQHAKPRNEQGQIIFVRGYPPPQLVKLIGARYRLDPELFRIHLAFGPTKDFFDIPVLPSSSENLVKLRITSIGRCSSTTADQYEGKDACYKHFQSLGSAGLAGESIVRNFARHDEEHFTIDQQISISVVRKAGGWVAIVLLDNGRDLDQGTAGPWFKQYKLIQEMFLPVLQIIPNVALESTNVGSPESHLMRPRATAQSGALLPRQQYALNLAREAMNVDAFYSLHHLFQFSAAAESQFLNMMRSKIETEFTKFQIRNDTYLERSLETFRRHRMILEDHLEYIQGATTTILDRGSVEWPKATPEAHQQVVEKAALRLETDFKMLHQLASMLIKRCEDGIEDARSSFMIAESRRTTESARGVTRLTLLAFLFVPVSFTSTFFGMNFPELGQGSLHIWAWFAFSVPVFILALVVCFWGPILRRFKHVPRV